MSYPRGIALLLLVFCPALTFAQDPPKTNDKSKTDSANQNTSEYFASGLQKFFLGWQYQYQYVEQPDFVLVTQGNTQVLMPNREHNLNQHSFIYDFGQVFLTPGQVKKLNSKVCSKGDDSPTCVAQPGVPKRFLSGIKITYTLAEHPVVVQGSILSPGYLQGGQVDFSPTNLFTTGTDWNDGLRKFHGLTRKEKVEAFFSVITPTFQYKRMTPFDFLKYAGTLIPSSTNGGLNTWSIIVDARRLIASPTSRLDTIGSADTSPPEAGRGDPTDPSDPSSKLCGLIFKGGSLSIISVPADTSKDSCLETAKAIHADKYELGCNGGKSIVLGAPEQVEPPVPASLPTPNSCEWK